MIHTKKNNRVKKTLISMAVLGMAFFLLGCYKQQTQGEVEEYVANTVPEKAKLVGYEEQQSKSGTVYCYIFKSESRDLEFRVFSSRGGGAIGGYTLTQYYDVGRDNYYLEKMRPLLTSCENSEMYVKPDAYMVSQKMYLEDEADARAMMKASYSRRMLMQGCWVVLAIILPCFQFAAGLIPLLFPGIGIKIANLAGVNE